METYLWKKISFGVYVSEERDGLGHEICNFAYINVYSGKNKIVYIHYVLN